MLKKTLKTLFVFILITLFLLPLSNIATKKTSQNYKNFKIVIDAGHGGIDGGSTGSLTGVKESELNLEIAKKLKKLFEKIGVEVIMTRESDVGLYGDTSEGFKVRDLKKRVQIINQNKPDLALSIHLNKYQKEYRRGAQVFYSNRNEKSKNLAKNVQFFLNLLPESKRIYDELLGDYYLLNYSNCPMVIVECGFLSNNEEERLLQTENYQNKLANAMYNGILKYLHS